MKPRTKSGSNDPTANLLLILSKAVQERNRALETIDNLLLGDWTLEQYRTFARIFQSEMAAQRLKGYQDGVAQGKLDLPDWVNQMAEDTYIRKIKNENSTL